MPSSKLHEASYSVAEEVCLIDIAVRNVWGILIFFLCAHAGSTFTVLFFQLIADILAHYLLSADDGGQRIQACILDCEKTEDRNL